MNAQYRLLKKFFPRSYENDAAAPLTPPSIAGHAKLRRLLGAEVLQSIRGKHVLDFGCGEGYEAISVARLGARQVTGVDIREEVLQIARKNAAAEGVGHKCKFVQKPTYKADLVISIDAFEHFANPSNILEIFDELLVPGGMAVLSFGPTWYHPAGGHLFSVFPWAHLLLKEEALIRWRSEFKSDGAQCFGEVAGGLNQLTIAEFEQIVSQSPFRFESFDAVPIRALQLLHNRFSREFTTSMVRCRLVRKQRSIRQNVIEIPLTKAAAAGMHR